MDGSDEMNCTRDKCSPRTVYCEVGHCIAQRQICDGKQNCEDNYDETGCDTTRFLKACCFILTLVVI